FRLFDRTTRNVSLTKYGAALVPVISRALTDVETATTALSASAREKDQSVSIGAAPLIATNLLAPAIKLFRARRPRVRIRIFDADLRTVMQSVESCATDMGIGVFSPSSAVRRVRLFRFSFIFIRPAEDATTRASSTTWSAAAAETLIALPATSPVQRVIDRQ